MTYRMVGAHVRRWFNLSASVGLAAALALAACDDDSTGPNGTLWEADLAGVAPYAAVDGLAEVDAEATSFTAEIELDHAIPDSVFAWRVAAGTCAAPGARVGTAANYPNLTVQDDSTASAQANVAAALSSTGSYIVSVRSAADSTKIVACGALQKD